MVFTGGQREIPVIARSLFEDGKVIAAGFVQENDKKSNERS